jgi:hypothetical protein
LTRTSSSLHSICSISFCDLSYFHSIYWLLMKVNSLYNSSVCAVLVSEELEEPIIVEAGLAGKYPPLPSFFLPSTFPPFLHSSYHSLLTFPSCPFLPPPSYFPSFLLFPPFLSSSLTVTYFLYSLPTLNRSNYNRHYRFFPI